MGHEEAAGAPVGETAPEFPGLPGPRGPESAVPQRVPAQAAPAPGLGARERAVLAFERRRWKHVGAKEQAIRDEFGVSPTNYYQILNALLDDPAASAHSPALVNRLRRARDARRRERSS